MTTKSIFLSKTVWGAVIALVATLFPHLFESVVAVLGVNDPTMLAAQIVGALGAILAIIGRLTAKTQVTITGK